MNKKRLISLVLGGLLSVSLISCGGKTNENGNDNTNSNSGKVEVIKEEAFATIPEQQLVTDYLKEYLQGGDELYQEGLTFKKLYWDDIIDEELMAKYDLKQFDGEYKIVDIYNLNEKLYNVAINYNTFGLNCEKRDIALFANKDLMPSVQNYLSDVWENFEDGEYKLSPEFEKLNPKKHVQNYLKENKIEISQIVYPTSANGFESISGSVVMNVPVLVEGTQNGEKFSKKVNLDFYFVVTNGLRTGTPEEVSPSNFEIMGVSISSDKKELNGYNYHFDYENAVKDYGIN